MWVILPTRVSRVSLEGAELARWDAPRPLLTAAFDGERLGVLDGAKITMLDKSTLEPQLSVNLTEPCKSAALVRSGPLACSSDSGAIYTVDTVTGALQSAKSSVVYQAAKTTTIPGTRRFFVANSSAFSTQVFEVDADGGAPIPVDGGTNLSSSVSLTPPWGFDAVPAQNLVTAQGVLLRMSGSCGGAGEPCFARTGTLGLLQANEAFLGLHSAGDALFGLLDSRASSSSFSSARCSTEPCRLLRIDVAAREIRAEQPVRRPLRTVVAMQPLPEQGAIVLGIGTAPPMSSFALEDAGYEVWRLDLATPQ